MLVSRAKTERGVVILLESSEELEGILVGRDLSDPIQWLAHHTSSLANCLRDAKLGFRQRSES